MYLCLYVHVHASEFNIIVKHTLYVQCTLLYIYYYNYMLIHVVNIFKYLIIILLHYKFVFLILISSYLMCNPSYRYTPFTGVTYMYTSLSHPVPIHPTCTHIPYPCYQPLHLPSTHTSCPVHVLYPVPTYPIQYPHIPLILSSTHKPYPVTHTALILSSTHKPYPVPTYTPHPIQYLHTPILSSAHIHPSYPVPTYTPHPTLYPCTYSSYQS